MRRVHFHSVARRKVRRAFGLPAWKPVPAWRWLLMAFDALGLPDSVTYARGRTFLRWARGTEFSFPEKTKR